MIIEQLYTGCLAQGAYYIESNGEAAVIDPLREVDSYLSKAKSNNANIKYVFETHFHADFVSGHLDLASKSGGKIIYGPMAQPKFDAHVATDGEVFQLGNITIQAIHTPGHTMESTTYLLRDENGVAKAIFTGDTLFIGDVGRPDLAQKVSSDLTQEVLAGHLYHSLRNKIMTLPDDIIVYPAHGAGSACGKNMSKETFDTLGNQKKVNYALQEMTKEEFIDKVTDGLLPPPAYFPENVRLNINGYQSLDSVKQQGLTPLDIHTFENIVVENNALILDTRAPQVFCTGFIPGSINIGIDGGFAPWVGALITNVDQPIVLITDKGREEEVVIRLSRVGFDNTLGYLEGGVSQWIEAGKELDTIETIDAHTLYNIMNNKDIELLDVRKIGEYSNEHIENIPNYPLDTIYHDLHHLDKNKTYYIHCAGGYRSMIYASILKSKGFQHVIDIKGGYSSIKNSNAFKLTMPFSTCNLK